MKCSSAFLFVLIAVVSCKLVLTPFGERPEECVHFVAKDEVASFDDLDEMFRIRKISSEGEGNIVREYPRCSVPFQQKSKVEPNGWAADAYWLTHKQLTDFGGVWTVPSYPQVEQVQTLFLFTGLQNSETSDVTIIQPVLQWGASEAGSSQNWTMSSWFVTESHASYSELTGPVQPGDTIVGNMTLNSNGQWVIVTADLTNGLSTTLTISTGVQEVDAFVTLEVYGISSCEDYPNGETTFSGLYIESNGTPQTPTWSVSTEPGCEEAVTVNSPSSVTIKF